ncbi:MAG: N-acetylglucosamine-6-phosphate deacetylase [Alphaproteobacteria bacterium]|nr:N-acetylglucosamine-6-phosphate deacetylase [Alphaproteobacteria bacterium]
MAGADAIVSAPRLLRDGALSGPGAVVVADGRIARVLDRVPPPGPGHVALAMGVLTPGLIDLHNNGCFGVDFATAGPEEWQRALAGLAAHGVTAVQPTVITAPLEAIAAAIGSCAAAAEALGDAPVARILGVHLEGPFIAPARRGAHRAAWIAEPTRAALDALLAPAPVRRMLRMVTLAPELPGALDAIRRLAAAGMVVALGHTDATHEQVAAAADAGARMVTHLFNAQRPLQHRDPGVPGAALTDPRLLIGLIVDGVHVHDLVCRLVFQAAPSRVVAVSDSILIAGLPEGSALEFGGNPVRVAADGSGRRPDGTIAGAGILLDEGVRRMIAAGIDPAQVLTAATETPARAIGRDDVGVLAAGAQADLVWWDDAFRPRRVWLGGQEVAHA